MLKIVADENIPFVQEVFGALGRVSCVAGREMTAAHVAGADVLLVRSVTRVDATLLADAPVRFVGTATIGTDHIDQDYLARRGTAFSSAAGSNANSVAEYVLTALLVLARRQAESLAGKTLGIVGVGNIGSILERKAPALGLEVICNDPPRARATGDARFRPLAEVLQADFVTCHVPLTRHGPDATWHLIDAPELDRMRPEAVLINSSRGAVVSNEALLTRLEGGRLRGAVLDVWEPEPDLRLDLLQRVDLGTPHIAGYSFDGKVNGTIMLYEALCRLLERPAEVTAADLLPPPPVPRIELDTEGRDDQELLAECLTTIYDIVRDDANLRRMAEEPPDCRAACFDRLRKTYPVRREAANTAVALRPARPSLAHPLARIGFQVE